MTMKIEKQSSKFIKPSIPTPPTLRHYKIGFIDELMPVINFGVVLFFSANSNRNPKFIAQLEKSYEKTLTRFYPLAGRYVEEIHTVDCNDQGAEFIHAEVNIKLQDILGSKVDVKLVDEFIPSETAAAEQVTDPILATQVTTFQCGGAALGVRVSHKIVDASTLSTFLNEWAAMNREENETEFTGPGFNSSSLFPARGLRPIELGLPRSKSDVSSKYVRKKLSFSESVISKMKKKAMLDGKNSTHQWSKVQLVSAIIWKAFIGADRAIHNYPRESILLQPVNLRERTASLIPKHSCGNLLGLLATESRMAETTEALADLLRDSAKKTMNNFSKVCHDSEEGQTMVLNSLPHMSNLPPLASVIWLTSWCKFPFYEADFGFGKPTWATLGSIPVKNSAYLMDDAGGEGVEAYVCMEVQDLPYFEEALDANAFAA